MALRAVPNCSDQTHHPLRADTSPKQTVWDGSESHPYLDSYRTRIRYKPSAGAAKLVLPFPSSNALIHSWVARPCAHRTMEPVSSRTIL